MKRMLSVVLCVLLLSGLLLPAQAAADRDPIVYVTGMMSSNLVKGETTVFPPAGSEIAKTVAALVPAYTAYRLTDNKTAFAQKIVSAVTDLYRPLLCDDTGTPTDKAVVPEKKNLVSLDQSYGKRNYFYYDWRLDATQTARDLDAYINAVLKATGRKTVALVCSSMGGCIGAAYLAQFGSARLSSLVFSSAATMGVTLVSMLFSDTLPLSENVVYDFLQSLELEKKANLSGSAKRALDAAGGFNAVLRDIASVAAAEKETLFQGLVIPFLSRMPGIWSFVKDGDFAAAKSATGVRAGTALAKKINAYHLTVRPNVRRLMQEALDDGVKLAILSNYKEPVRLTEDNVLTDGLIPTESTSFGATCAATNTWLMPDPEADETALQYLSPDHQIDSSTCAFPEHTWFIKGADHAYSDAAFLRWVAYTKGDVDIYANEGYPQFLKWTEHEAYVPQLSDGTNLPAALLAILPQLLEQIRALLRVLAEGMSMGVTV